MVSNTRGPALRDCELECVLVTSVNLTLTSLFSRCPTPSWISLRTRITNPGITDERIPSAVIEKEREQTINKMFKEEKERKHNQVHCNAKLL